MRFICSSWCWVVVLVLSSCSASTKGPDDVGAFPDLADEVPPIVCLGATCTVAADCAKTGPCIAATNCMDGCCSYIYKKAGTACEVPCEGAGTCSASGECQGTEPMVCEDQDGNPCTTPWCDPESGECSLEEKPVADGTQPVESNCWEGLACKDGKLHEGGATPTLLQQDCAAQNAALSPLGCVEQVVCVDSQTSCVVLLKDEGSQCWSGSGGDDGICQGESCSAEGECVADETFTVECGDDSWPEECDQVCRECTSLTCHWIDDPAGGNPSNKKVKYCRPEAAVGGTCDDGNDCTLGDACAFASQADGPLGKETLGTCKAGEGKTKDECLAQWEKPALPCLKAGTTCDPEAGCAFDQAAADEWCYPATSVCFKKSQTYCTHQDALGDGKWNGETGCHIVIFAAEGCDDANPCTQDPCDTESGCVNTPVQDGTPCGSDKVCKAGNCEPLCQPDCVGKQCGDDGCGGSCGTCSDQNVCDGGTCKPDCTPVNGGWTDWSCGACSVQCGGGTHTCNRSCTNPAPSCGGTSCVGEATKNEACNTQSCAVIVGYRIKMYNWDCDSQHVYWGWNVSPDNDSVNFIDATGTVSGSVSNRTINLNGKDGNASFFEYKILSNAPKSVHQFSCSTQYLAGNHTYACSKQFEYLYDDGSTGPIPTLSCVPDQGFIYSSTTPSYQAQTCTW